jgi:hypothetical protein
VPDNAIFASGGGPGHSPPALASDRSPTLPEARGVLVDPRACLAVCGDGVNGSRVEGAPMSGVAAAERLLDALSAAAAVAATPSPQET